MSHFCFAVTDAYGCLLFPDDGQYSSTSVQSSTNFSLYIVPLHTAISILLSINDFKKKNTKDYSNIYTLFDMIFCESYVDNVHDVDEICKTDADTHVLRFDSYIPSHLQVKDHKSSG